MPPKTKITKERILDAAMHIVRKDGIDAVTAKSLAKKLKCSTQPIYWVFDTIENLKNEIIAESSKVYNDYILRDTDENRFRAIGLNYLTFAIEEKNLFKLLFMSDRGKEKNIFSLSIDDNEDEIVNIVIKQSNLTYDKAYEVYLDLWVFTHGIASLIVSGMSTFSNEQVSKMMTDIYLGLVERMKKTV